MIYKAYEDSNFVTGDSPVTHDVLTDLGKYATGGQITNAGGGNMTIKVEGNRKGMRSDFDDDVLIAAAESFTVYAGTVFNLGSLGMNIKQ